MLLVKSNDDATTAKPCKPWFYRDFYFVSRKVCRSSCTTAAPPSPKSGMACDAKATAGAAFREVTHFYIEDKPA